MLRATLALGFLAEQAAAVAVELTDANYKKTVEGKNALLWFHAPW
jgi:hypothetical protein